MSRSSAQRPGWAWRILRATTVAALVFAALIPVSALVLDKGFGRTVQPVTKSAPEVIALNRELHSPGEPVAAIYGIPTDRKIRVLFVSKERILRPAEDPSLRLLPLDKQKGDNPLQTKTVWFIAWRASALLLLGALLGFGLLFLLRWRAGRRLAVTQQLSAPQTRSV